MEIRLDNLGGTEIATLLEAHHQDMLRHSPPESVHALDLSKLKTKDITFWTLWIDNELAGCGAIKELTDTHAEIKSMRTSSTHLRQGVAESILTHILAHARSKNYHRISLETGSMEAFVPARNLYLKHGFGYCEPFSDYEEDPYSLFMTLVFAQ